MALVSITTFNANNLFLRYDFERVYPGGSYDAGARIADAETRLGYLPGLSLGGRYQDRFVIWDETRRRVAAQALREPHGELPDILCLQEVENIHALRVFNADYLDGHYPHALLIDGYDPRNIDVGVLSRFPIAWVRTHVDDTDTDGSRVFSRDCLEVTLQVTSNRRITLFVNHLKSKWARRKRGESAAAFEARKSREHALRRAQAQAIRDAIRDRFRANDDVSLYAVVGDFNDTPKSPWLTPLTNPSARLWDVVRRHRPEDDAWTYYWRHRREVMQVDYVLGSRGFRDAVDAAVASDPALAPHIERAGLGYRRYNAAGDDILPARAKLVDHDPQIEVPFRFPRYAAVLEDDDDAISDHCPVRVWLEI